MEFRKPKTLDDFPKFAATALRRGPTAEAGYTYSELEGSFDRTIESTGPQWFWLLFGTCGSLCASVQWLNPETRAAILTFEETDEPDTVGHTLVI